jgi:hypothetical protein
MVVVGGLGDRLEFAARLAEVVLRVVDHRHGVATLRDFVEEVFLHARRPADHLQQADPLRDRDHARIERGVVGDVGGERGHG